MDVAAVAEREAAEALLTLYEEALPEVYGYLLHRCGDPALAEDLSAEAFLAAARTIARGSRVEVTLAWLVAVARNKLVDEWRRGARERRSLERASTEAARSEAQAAPDDEGRALETLRRLGPDQRTALLLRHVDGLSVPEVATQLGRTVHATEALLSRARRAFRRLYDMGDDDGTP